MLNWHAIETETAYRRDEWERAIAAIARAEQARPTQLRIRWPRLALPEVARLLALRLPVSAPALRCRAAVC